MRKIDADIIVNEIDEALKELVENEEELARKVFTAFKEMLEKQPTVEEVTGEWINEVTPYGTVDVKCSICGRKIEVGYEETLDDFQFCHCGSKNREVE